MASQDTKSVWCQVSFAGESPTCECICHTTGKGRRCKHIAAVEHILLILFEVVLDKKVDSSPDLGHLDHHPSLREESSETVLFIIRSSYFGPRCVVVECT